jgi:hypothetical protein
MEGKKYTFSEKREEKHAAKLGVLAVKELAVHQNITAFRCRVESRGGMKNLVTYPFSGS